MKWIGLTGGIACGKSTVAQRLLGLGIPVLDADQIVHKLLEPEGECFSEVIQTFGRDILRSDGAIDRRKLGQLVFGRADQLAQLESILHPKVRVATRAWRTQQEKNGSKFAVYDVPLLFEKKMESEFDWVVVVACESEIQRERLKARNHLTDQEIEHRLFAQLPIGEKIGRADFVIYNNGTLAELDAEIQKLVKQIRGST